MQQYILHRGFKVIFARNFFLFQQAAANLTTLRFGTPKLALSSQLVLVQVFGRLSPRTLERIQAKILVIYHNYDRTGSFAPIFMTIWQTNGDKIESFQAT